MKKHNILVALLLMMVSPSVLATKFTVVNESGSRLSYNPVWNGAAQGWKEVEKDLERKDNNSGFDKIRGIWWKFTTGNPYLGQLVNEVYYLADLDGCDIPIARLFGVKIIIKSEGRIEAQFDGKSCKINGELSGRPPF